MYIYYQPSPSLMNNQINKQIKTKYHQLHKKLRQQSLRAITVAAIALSSYSCGQIHTEGPLDNGAQNPKYLELENGQIIWAINRYNEEGSMTNELYIYEKNELSEYIKDSSNNIIDTLHYTPINNPGIFDVSVATTDYNQSGGMMSVMDHPKDLVRIRSGNKMYHYSLEGKKTEIQGYYELAGDRGTQWVPMKIIIDNSEIGKRESQEIGELWSEKHNTYWKRVQKEGIEAIIGNQDLK